MPSIDVFGNECFFDEEDRELVESKHWRPLVAAYAANFTSDRSGKSVVFPMHRLIMAKYHCIEGKVIDHIDGNGFNNVKANLRVCTQAENVRNRVRATKNKSGFTGVDRLPSGKWRAKIKLDGRQIHIGCFQTFEEAVDSRIAAEQKYFGEFAPRRGML